MTAEQRTVLVLDDEKVVRESLVDYFEDSGWRVLPAVSAELGLEILGRERVDGALVDMRLPGMSGDAFIREAHRLRPGMAFVVVTGSPELCPSGGSRELAEGLPGTSGRIFEKPIQDLEELETELWRQIELRKGSVGP